MKTVDPSDLTYITPKNPQPRDAYFWLGEGNRDHYAILTVGFDGRACVIINADKGPAEIFLPGERKRGDGVSTDLFHRNLKALAEHAAHGLFLYKNTHAGDDFLHAAIEERAEVERRMALTWNADMAPSLREDGRKRIKLDAAASDREVLEVLVRTLANQLGLQITDRAVT